jgi:GNAT superfamily N-acetyltransferase
MPEHQGRGVASMLLREMIEVADKSDPPAPMYLECMPDAKVIYEHHGWKGVEGLGRDDIMLRRGPGK